MTTKKDASGTPDYVGLVDPSPYPPVKRYDLGTRFYNSLSVPEIVETTDGKYVTHDDYLTVVKINDYLQARLVKQAAQMQAIVKAAQRTRAEPVARWAVSGEYPGVACPNCNGRGRASQPAEPVTAPSDEEIIALQNAFDRGKWFGAHYGQSAARALCNRTAPQPQQIPDEPKRKEPK